MTDWNKFMVRHAGTGTEFAVNEARLVAVDELGKDSESGDLYNILSAFEDDLARTERDLDSASDAMDRFHRLFKDQTKAVQSLVDEIKEMLVEGGSWRIDDWDDLFNAFGRIDGLDLEKPRREWSAEVEVTVTMSLSGDANSDLDEYQIADMIRDHFGMGDITIDLEFETDDVSADDSNVENYDLDVSVDFND